MTPEKAAQWLGIIVLGAVVAALLALLAFGLIRVGLWALCSHPDRTCAPDGGSGEQGPGLEARSRDPHYLVEPRAPLEVWAPAFEWLDPRKIVPAEILRIDVPGGRFCKLCEAVVRPSALAEHAAGHRVEFKSWRSQRRSAARREAVTRLRGINAERKLARRVLDGAA